MILQPVTNPIFSFIILEKRVISYFINDKKARNWL